MVWWLLRFKKAKGDLDGVLKTLMKIEDCFGKEKLSLFLEAITMWKEGDKVE